MDEHHWSNFDKFRCSGNQVRADAREAKRVEAVQQMSGLRDHEPALCCEKDERGDVVERELDVIIRNQDELMGLHRRRTIEFVEQIISMSRTSPNGPRCESWHDIVEGPQMQASFEWP